MYYIYVILPAGKSVLGKSVPDISSINRGRRPWAVLKTKGTAFPIVNRPGARFSKDPVT